MTGPEISAPPTSGRAAQLAAQQAAGPAPVLPRDLTVWVLSDGKPGMQNQCVGLAEALGAEPVVKRIAPRFPWSKLPPQLWLAPLSAPGPDGDAIAPPWPDLLIATGRQTVAVALAIKAASGGRTFCVQIQNPTTGTDRFDLIAVPKHDRMDGPNVVLTDGALHRVTREKLEDAAARFRGTLSHLPHPLVAVLVGGSNGKYRMTEAAARNLAQGLRRLCTEHGAGLAVTASRRTGAANEGILRDALAGLPAEIWDGTGENPYFAYLGLADAIVVTADSVSMTTEACSTGKPVYVAELEGGSAKFERFHASLRDQGITRRFEGRLEDWSYPAVNDTMRVAEEVRHRLARHLSAIEIAPAGR